jgi:phosphoglycolate phosphatase-like HAD superfamily hydrolase
MIKGSENLLKRLKEKDIAIFVASGTDHADVIEETEILGVGKYFNEVAGAPEGRADCSKEAVLKKLITEKRLNGYEVMVAGDGKVEIALGKEAGTITLGVASCEDKLYGVNPAKRKRLIRAG